MEIPAGGTPGRYFYAYIILFIIYLHIIIIVCSFIIRGRKNNIFTRLALLTSFNVEKAP